MTVALYEQPVHHLFSMKGAPQVIDANVLVMALDKAGKIRLTWSSPRRTESGHIIIGYSVQYRRNNTFSYTTHTVSGYRTTSYTITNLTLGTVYEVRVASVGPLGPSRYCCGNGKQVMTLNGEYLA